jgi:hypothetical protein
MRRNGTDGSKSMENLYSGSGWRTPKTNDLSANRLTSRIADMLRLHGSTFPFVNLKNTASFKSVVKYTSFSAYSDDSDHPFRGKAATDSD